MYILNELLLSRHAISYDEKPGIQDIANKYPDYNSTEGNDYICRNYEHVCFPILPPY